MSMVTGALVSCLLTKYCILRIITHLDAAFMLKFAQGEKRRASVRALAKMHSSNQMENFNCIAE